MVVEQHHSGYRSGGPVRQQQKGFDPLVIGNVVFDQVTAVSVPLFGLEDLHPWLHTPPDVQRSPAAG